MNFNQFNIDQSIDYLYDVVASRHDLNEKKPQDNKKWEYEGIKLSFFRNNKSKIELEQ